MVIEKNFENVEKEAEKAPKGTENLALKTLETLDGWEKNKDKLPKHTELTPDKLSISNDYAKQYPEQASNILTALISKELETSINENEDPENEMKSIT